MSKSNLASSPIHWRPVAFNLAGVRTLVWGVVVSQYSERWGIVQVVMKPITDGPLECQKFQLSRVEVVVAFSRGECSRSIGNDSQDTIPFLV